MLIVAAVAMELPQMEPKPAQASTCLLYTSHFLCFAWLDMGLNLQAIVRDITKRPFILVGSAALLLMLPLAATSFNAAIRWLGAKRWQALHRAVYATALLAILHFCLLYTSRCV